jgi:hypothetical protein
MTETAQHSIVSWRAAHHHLEPDDRSEIRVLNTRSTCLVFVSFVVKNALL